MHNPRAPEWYLLQVCPVLGICYGMQTMAVQLGGEVRVILVNENLVMQKLKLHGHSQLFSARLKIVSPLMVTPC